jgi:hypothetical protein
VSDVAALVERTVIDRSTRGATLEIGGPENVSFNELAAGLQWAAGGTARPRHIPRPMLHLLAAVLGGVQPNRARQMGCGDCYGHHGPDVCADRSPSPVPGAYGDVAGRHTCGSLDGAGSSPNASGADRCLTGKSGVRTERPASQD